MITITLPVKEYLAKYIRVRYEKSTEQGAVRLPGTGILYHCLHQLTSKRPKGASWKDEGNLTLALPCPVVGKSPQVYNFLSKENAQILEKKLNGS